MLPRDQIIRGLASWMMSRITRKHASRDAVVDFLLHLSPEERSGIWKLRTFYGRYNRGKQQKPQVDRTAIGGWRPKLQAWAKRAS